MELVFIRGSSIRRVFIRDRKISFIIPENGFVPIEIDLDKLNKKDFKGKFDTEFAELSKLKTEEDMVRDITRDFQKQGWRRIHHDRDY